MKVRLSAFVLLLSVAFSAVALAQAQDLSGTWTGDTLVPDSPDKDSVTLVLKKDGSSYTGTVTDSMGMANAAALQNVKTEKDSLAFEFVITVNNENVRIRVALTAREGKLVGNWTSEDGATGALELTRKK